MDKSRNPSGSDILEDDRLSQISSTSQDIYKCEICGATFNNPNSLRMHAMRSHRVRIDFEGAPRPSRPIEIEAPEIPDALTQLHNFLKAFLSERDAKAVLRYMENYSLDDLVRLNTALRDVGLALNRRRLLIESWANMRAIPIPPNLAMELGINLTPSPSYFEHKRDDLTIFDYLLKWESLKREVPSQPQFQMQDQIQEIVKSYEGRIIELQKEIQTLKDSLNRKELETLQERLKELNDKVEKVKEEAMTSKSELSTLITTLSKHIEGVADRLETLAMAKMGFIRADLIEKFQLPEKKVEEGAESFLNKVNPKWVTES